jgi:L-threonylcarbamoyladenylate synthase
VTDPERDPAIRDALDRAAAVIEEGGLAIYPTETVYGLGADAVTPTAVQRVFEVKRRERSEPISLATPDVESALSYVGPEPKTERFMRDFLPGPVTVVCPRRAVVPDVLTAGSDRVGVRVPDHPVALALLDRVSPTPVTATSANVSGRTSARRVDRIAPEVRETCAIVDAGETPGGGSTVVDVAREEIIRRGPQAESVAEWLDSSG